jgi:hypothetical protein
MAVLEFVAQKFVTVRLSRCGRASQMQQARPTLPHDMPMLR